MIYLVTKLAPLFLFKVHLGAVPHCMSQSAIEMYGSQLERLFLYFYGPYTALDANSVPSFIACLAFPLEFRTRAQISVRR